MCQVFAGCQDSHNGKTLRAGFLKSGIKLLPNGSFDFRLKMATCLSVIPEQDLVLMENALPKAIELCRSKGYLTEVEMDELGIPTCEIEEKCKLVKDKRAISHQRTLLWTSPSNLLRFRVPLLSEGGSTKTQRKLNKKAEEDAEKVALQEFLKSRKADKQKKKEEKKVKELKEKEEKKSKLILERAEKKKAKDVEKMRVKEAKKKKKL